MRTKKLYTHQTRGALHYLINYDLYINHVVLNCFNLTSDGLFFTLISDWGRGIESVHFFK